MERPKKRVGRGVVTSVANGDKTALPVKIARDLEDEESYATHLEQRLAEVEADVARWQRRLAWVLNKAGGVGIEATHNRYTGYFLHKPIYRNGELYDRTRIAYSGRDGCWAEAIDNAMAGRDPDADCLADIRAERKRRKDSRAAVGGGDEER